MDEWGVLAAAASDGDRRALAQLIRSSQSDVYRVCERLGPHGQAEDLTQETYIRMLKSLPGFRGDSLFRTWLLTIARRCAEDARRRHQRRTIFQRAQAESAPVATSADSSLAVRDLIEYLAPERREAFVFTQLVGLTYEETAKVCGVPLGTVRSRVARARGELIALIEEDSPIKQVANK